MGEVWIVVQLAVPRAIRVIVGMSLFIWQVDVSVTPKGQTKSEGEKDLLDPSIENRILSAWDGARDILWKTRTKQGNCTDQGRGKQQVQHHVGCGSPL